MSLSSQAQDFLRRSPRVKIGTVLSQRGTLIGLGLADRSISYLKRGDPLFDKQTFVTRSNSQAVLKIGAQSELILGSNTKITVINLSGSTRYLVRIVEGAVRHDYKGAGVPELFVSGKSFGTYYSSIEFDAILKGTRFYFKPKSGFQVYKYQREGLKGSRGVEISKKQIELLSQRAADNQPVYLIKDPNKLKKKTAKTKTKADSSNPFGDVSSLSEASSIFGESIANSTAVQDASAIFGDLGGSSSNVKNQAADIFGEDVQIKSEREREKLRDNVGVKLQEKLKDFEKISEKVKKEKASAFKDLDLSLFLKSTYYASAPRSDIGNVDQQQFHQDFRLSMANKILINSSESLTMSGWVEGSNRKDVYNELGDTLDLQSSKRNYLYLNELYYTYTTKKFDIQFGKKIIKFGKGIVYSPSDALSAVDATVPTAPVYLGSFIISIDYYLKDWTLSGIFFPAIMPNKSPSQNSRWTTLYSDIDFKLEQDFPSGFGPRSKQFLVKLEGTKYGTDWLFTFFNGPNSNPVIRNDIVVNNNVPSFTLVQEHIPITYISAGFSTTFGGLEVHGEVLNQNAEDGKDDSFTAMMIGGRYSMDVWPKAFGLNSIDMVIEHGRESLRSAQSQPFYALSSIGSRFYQNSWVGTFIFNVTDKFSFNYDYHFDLKNSGAATILGMNYTSGDTQWRFKIESYDGEETSNFGKWKDNDNSTLEYIVSF